MVFGVNSMLGECQGVMVANYSWSALLISLFLHSQGKLPLSGMAVSRCEETEKYPNGFEISGTTFFFYLLLPPFFLLHVAPNGCLVLKINFVRERN